MQSYFMSLATMMLVATTSSLAAQEVAASRECCVIKVSGPQQICRTERQNSPFATYTATTSPTSTSVCTYTWIVTNGVTFTSSGNNIHITSIPATVTHFTVSAFANCPNSRPCVNYVSQPFAVSVSLMANASFNLTVVGAGNSVNASATPMQPACQHYWALYKADCTTQNPMGLIVSGSTPNFNATGLPAGQCYVLYHWVRCGSCKWVMKRRFFEVTPASALARNQESDTEPTGQFKTLLDAELNKLSPKE